MNTQMDHRDKEVVEDLEQGETIRGWQLRDKYRRKTDIRSKHKARNRAKRLTQSGLFAKVNWGKWEYQGEGR